MHVSVKSFQAKINLFLSGYNYMYLSLSALFVCVFFNLFYLHWKSLYQRWPGDVEGCTSGGCHTTHYLGIWSQEYQQLQQNTHVCWHYIMPWVQDIFIKIKVIFFLEIVFRKNIMWPFIIRRNLTENWWI